MEQCMHEDKFVSIKFPCVLPIPFKGFLVSRYIPEIKKQLAQRELSIHNRINIMGKILK